MIKYLDHLTKNQSSIGFVATMGALHEGHLKLVQISQSECDVTVCSIFVNPTQFNNPDDLANYPRPLADDIRKLTDAGCDVLFHPSYEEMYADTAPWHLELGPLEHILEGEFRPGHYQGVTQIVSKLFNVVKPDQAFFGQKDFQQFKVIERMTALLNLPVKLVMCPIVRENDGLAMSSRNTRLSQEERMQAPLLYEALSLLRTGIGEKPLPELRENAALHLRAGKDVKLEYLEICDAATLAPAESSATGQLIALIAAWVGGTRLIDNVML